MIAGFLIVFLSWMCLYGLNVPLRAYLVRRHQHEHEVLMRIDVRHQPKESGGKVKRWLVPLAIGVSIWAVVRLIAAGSLHSFSDGERLVIGMLGGLLLIAALWPLYQRSATRNVEIVLFDRHGVTMVAPRYGLLSQGAFQMRIEWKDCFGYSVFRGHVMFALRPIGHVEQVYGQFRQSIQSALSSLGIPKLNAYDVIGCEEVASEELAAIEREVLLIAQDVAASYSTELLSEGLAVGVELLHEREEEEERSVEHATLRFSLIEGQKSLHDLDWMIWAKYDETLELLAMPKHQYYEELDTRVQSLVEMRLRELGVEQKLTVLQ